MRRELFTAVAAAVPALLSPSVTSGQIVFRADDVTRTSVAPGATFSVPIIVDLSQSGGAAIVAADVLIGVGGRYTLDSLVNAAGRRLTDAEYAVRTWRLSFDFPARSTTFELGRVFLHASTTPGGGTIALSGTTVVMSGEDWSRSTDARSLDVCVRDIERWGDVTTDGAVDIIDAQQIARSVVGLSTSASRLMNGDVNGDGTTDIIDAQQIARYTVALPAAPRTSQVIERAPVVATIRVERPFRRTVAIGERSRVHAVLLDASGEDQSGCAPVAWSSSAAGVATVDSTGGLGGVASGIAAITAAAGGAAGATNVGVGSAHSARFVVISGDHQTAPMLTSLPDSLKLRLVDLDGHAWPGVSTAFTVLTGDGVVRAGIGSPDSLGTLPSPTWTLGIGSGDQTLQAFTPNGEASPVTVTATATGTVVPLQALSVSPGGNTVCARRVDATVACWGSNLHGALGDATNVEARPTPGTISGGAPFSEVITAGTNSCGVAGTSTLCWGSNFYGELGNGTTTASSTPVTAATSEALHGLAAGYCGLGSTGAAWCWGASVGGGTVTIHSTPVLVDGGFSFTQLATGIGFHCGLTTDGKVYCWGRNDQSQLGDGTATDRLTPTAVASDSVFIAVAAGGFHTCALTRSGATMCWGETTVGQGGIIRVFPLLVPTLVAGAPKFSSIALGDDHSCGLAGTTVYCWGSNAHGRAGIDGSYTAIPTAVHGGASYSSITAGGALTCAITSAPANVVQCWGDNTFGQLGPGALAPWSAWPVPIVLRIDP